MKKRLEALGVALLVATSMGSAIGAEPRWRLDGAELEASVQGEVRARPNGPGLYDAWFSVSCSSLGTQGYVIGIEAERLPHGVRDKAILEIKSARKPRKFVLEGGRRRAGDRSASLSFPLADSLKKNAPETLINRLKKGKELLVRFPDRKRQLRFTLQGSSASLVRLKRKCWGEDDSDAVVGTEPKTGSRRMFSYYKGALVSPTVALGGESREVRWFSIEILPANEDSVQDLGALLRASESFVDHQFRARVKMKVDGDVRHSDTARCRAWTGNRAKCNFYGFAGVHFYLHRILKGSPDTQEPEELRFVLPSVRKGLQESAFTVSKPYGDAPATLSAPTGKSQVEILLRRSW